MNRHFPGKKGTRFETVGIAFAQFGRSTSGSMSEGRDGGRVYKGQHVKVKSRSFDSIF